MPSSDPIADTKASLQAVLKEAQSKLTKAESVAEEIPLLRRQIRALERALSDMDADQPVRQRAPGATSIEDAVMNHLRENGGQIDFPPGGMLQAVHSGIGGNRSSVQVQVNRMCVAGKIERIRDDNDRPIGLRIVPPPAPLAAVPEQAQG